MFSVLFSILVLTNQFRRVGKHLGRPARRRLGRAEIEKNPTAEITGEKPAAARQGIRGLPVDDRQIGTRLMTGIRRLLDHDPGQ
jgi:hypothetical protein